MALNEPIKLMASGSIKKIDVSDFTEIKSGAGSTVSIPISDSTTYVCYYIFMFGAYLAENKGFLSCLVARKISTGWQCSSTDTSISVSATDSAITITFPYAYTTANYVIKVSH